MERILITGANGFVGPYLVTEALRQYPKAKVLGLGLLGREELPRDPRFKFRKADILSPHELLRIVRTFRPTQVYHLAGYSLVAESFDHPLDAMRLNVDATMNLFDALLRANLRPKVLLVSSGQVYGRTFFKKPCVAETDPCIPASPYTLTKIMAEDVALYYATNHKLHVVIARPMNHIGPGQRLNFAVSSFAQQFTLMKPGRENLLKVGNLEVSRDMTDVRDIVRGYVALMKKGCSGEVYNLGSGRTVSLKWIVRELERLSGIRPRIVQTVKARPTDLKTARVKTLKIKRQTGWTPRIPLTKTLEDVYCSLKGC